MAEWQTRYFEGVVKIVSWEFESPPLHIEFEVSRYLLSKCGNSSVGRARPCQGRGREFESRLPLIIKRNIQNIILMNLYIRYFDNEVLVHNAEEALDFLSTIPDIQLTPDLEADIRNYAANDVFYPKRYKVRPRVYFIVIKTEAATMMDFKQKKSASSKWRCNTA